MDSMSMSSLEMLARIYCDPNGHPEEGALDGCYRASLNWLIENHLIVSAERDKPYTGRFKTTERGAIFLEYIRMLPLPRQEWVMYDPTAKAKAVLDPATTP